MKFLDLKKDFYITVEVPPPKGTDYKKFLQYAIDLKGKTDLINVTDNQMAVMRMSALAFSKILKDNGLEPNMQICCRDKNRLALQSEILGAHALGIENITLMTGDYVTAGDHKKGKPVFDLDSVQLIHCANNLRKGLNETGKNINGSPDFCIGAVVNPCYSPLELQLLKMKKKINEGAEFFQTQPIYSKRVLETFLEEINKAGIQSRILIGITPLKSLKFIDFMNNNILSEPIDEVLYKRIENSSDPLRESMDIALEFMLEIKKQVDGFHIMPIGCESSMPELLDNFYKNV
ncbi:MAG: methylenetetrahydrofolate reductase [Nitrospinae bacterium]|nr:methylenetetrahydrofolate reductase [Nitrospinota bacterium]